MLECVVNVSEGRSSDLLGRLVARAQAAEPDSVLDVHSDPHHHRSVLTLVGEAAPRAVTAEAVAALDLSAHEGAHPRLGVVDVVPFVPLGGSTLAHAITARDRFATWAGEALGVPCFVYGPERSLPEVRRRAWRDLGPDTGPARPHPTAGAICVGARPVLVAYNVWLAPGASADDARRVAAEVRGPAIRALGLVVGDRLQVSMNLVRPDDVGPADAFDAVAARIPVAGAELVGLVPEKVLARIPRDRWGELDLGPERTIEHRLAHPWPSTTDREQARGSGGGAPA